MNRRSAFTSISIVLLCSGLLSSGDAAAQQKTLRDQILGTWSFVSTVNTRPDGSKYNPWGENPTGILMYSPNGRFAFMIIRSDIPKLDREKGTPEQFTAAYNGQIAYHGTFTVDEKTKTIVHKVAGSTFSGFNGAEQKRVVTSVTADELRYTNATSSFGAKVDSLWRRAK